MGEALFLGDEPMRGVGPFLNRSAMRREAASLLKSYFDLELPDNALISELTTAEKQIIQITRALIRNMIEGVTKGYEKSLEVVGVGWTAAVAGRTRQLNR